MRKRWASARTHKSSTALPCKCHNTIVIVNSPPAPVSSSSSSFFSFVPFNFVVVGFFSTHFCHHSLLSSAFWLFEFSFILFNSFSSFCVCVCVCVYVLPPSRYLIPLYHFHLLSSSFIHSVFLSLSLAGSFAPCTRYLFCICVCQASLCIHNAMLIIIMTVINMQIYFVVYSLARRVRCVCVRRRISCQPLHTEYGRESFICSSANECARKGRRDWMNETHV